MNPEPKIHVHESNRAERLVAGLAGHLERTALDPFSRFTVVVQSRGIAAWLRTELARHLGICAQVAMPFPRSFIARALAAAGDPSAPSSLWTAEAILWAVLAELDSIHRDPELEPLRRRVGKDEDGERRFDLALRIARVFDRYTVYRPDLLEAWREGRDDDIPPHERWQARLWRKVEARLPAVGPGAAVAGLGERAEQDPQGLHRALQAAFPAGVHVFGATGLPPLYLDALAAIARVLDVHVWQPWPARAVAEDGSGAGVRTLAASFGALGAETARLLRRHVRRRHPDWSSVGAGSALGVLQQELAAGRVEQLRLFEAPSRARVRLSPDDDSLEIHVCHSPTREVEALRERLLDLLLRERLAPRDIVVLLPDVEKYAPIVEAVFATDPEDPHHIPYTISDRIPRRVSPLVEALHAVLQLAHSRVRASELVEILAMEPVQRRFGFAGEDLDVMRHWIAAAGIRWGIDAEHRARQGAPARDGNTWRFGLDRLLVGHACPPHGRRLLRGVLGMEGVEGGLADLAGRFALACERILDEVAGLRRPRTMSDWRADLERLVPQCFDPGPSDSWQEQAVFHVLSELEEEAAAAGFTGEIPVGSLARLLLHRLEAASSERGFLQGGVTFGAMLPLRSVPFEVVCMLGLDDGVFPRAESAPDFDLTRKHPRPGDRDQRKDDRWLFLEALAAARRRLILSYCGESARDLASLPPSVVVQELLDAACERFDPPDEPVPTDERRRREAVVRHLTVRHALHPFHPCYFQRRRHPRLFSHSQPYLAAARALVGPRSDPPPFLDAELPPQDPPSRVSVEELARFLGDPVRCLLRSRLGLVPDDDDLEPLEDRERLAIEGLDRWTLADHLLRLRREGIGADRCRRILLATGSLPPGALGAAALAELEETVDDLVDSCERLAPGERAPDLWFELPLREDLVLEGYLGPRYGDVLAHVQVGRTKLSHLLLAWFTHLVAQALQRPARSILLSKDDRLVFEDARALDEGPLETLARAVQWLLEGRRAPLRIAPEATLAYGRAAAADDPPQTCLERALRAWHQSGEDQRPWYRQLFPEGRPPFEEVAVAAPPSFEELAHDLAARPLRAAREVGDA